MHKFYSQITLPNEFKPWINPFDPILGTFDPRHSIEHHVPLAELKEHNPEFCTWIDQLGLEVFTARFLRSQPRVVYSAHIDINPMTGAPPNFYGPDDDFQALEFNALEDMAAQDQLAEAKRFVYDNSININLVFNSHGSVMKWYRLKEGCRPIFKNSYSNHYYYKFIEEDCEVVYETACDTDCLVNSGVPHDLTNSSNDHSPRMCYSLMIQNKERTLTWDQAVEKLTPGLDVAKARL